MTTLSYTKARNNLAYVMKKATDDREPITVTHKGHKPVVVLSLSEFESIKETLHLLSSPLNARRLSQGLVDFEKGRFSGKEISD